MKQIADKADQIILELYTAEDIFHGSSLKMHEEARKMALKLFDMIDTIKQLHGGEIDHTEAPEDKPAMWEAMEARVEAYGIEETIKAYAYWTDCTEEEARNELSRH
jgi:hypothetical protein